MPFCSWAPRWAWHTSLCYNHMHVSCLFFSSELSRLWDKGKQVLWRFCQRMCHFISVTCKSNDRSCVLKAGAREIKVTNLPSMFFFCLFMILVSDVDSCFLAFRSLLWHYLHGKTKSRLLVLIRTLVSKQVGWNLTNIHLSLLAAVTNLLRMTWMM